MEENKDIVKSQENQTEESIVKKEKFSVGRMIIQLIQGALIGVGGILPGVSGGVLCVMFGIYKPIMELIANPFKRLKTHAPKLFFYIIGCAAGFLGIARLLAFVLEKYPLSPEVIENLFSEGCECGAHGLFHDGKLFMSLSVYKERMKRIESIGRSLGMNGFRSPSLHRNRDWMSSMTWRWDSSFP
ncbi:MAG TPA: DUF368 domain-containing protein, partial [Saccharofermentans sp.]|nr:DUF368 domain-containing protein [Saccharofermentans sp.]